ncbi:MAG: CDF family Co(II)/Ni(II) efflux transporter DmeF [Sphingomicrobium sp.]
MNDQIMPAGEHNHIFLGAGHAANERGTWAAISLAGFMMVAEIAGGTLFGSLAVVADGFHMATHALALLIAAVAYSYARRHVNDPRFVFGTGKLGDLAGFSSALVLAIIAVIIGFEAAVRLFWPVTIHFDEAILIAAGGFIVNIATAWLLSAGGGDHHRDPHGTEHEHNGAPATSAASRDYNMRAAFVHVAADAAVSVLAICGLLLGRFFGWVWMDPVMGLVGALVIANWAFGLIRDTAGVLLDMEPDKAMAEELRRTLESDGDRLADLHLWRLGPGHLGAIVSIMTAKSRDAEFYRSRLRRFRMLSHVTIEVRRVITSGNANETSSSAAG